MRKNRARSEPRYCTRETKGFNPLFKCVTKVGADYEGKFRASENPDPYEKLHGQQAQHKPSTAVKDGLQQPIGALLGFQAGS